MQVAVIGLGRFGSSLAEMLIEEGHEVIVIDKQEKLVQEFEGKADEPIVGDATDETLIRSIGPSQLDAVVVAIGDDVEASVLVCMTLMDLRAKFIVAKAESDKHARILKRLGVHRIVQPERDSAKRVLDMITHPNFFDKYDIGEDHVIVEIKAPKSFWGKSLKDLDLRRRYNVLVIAIKRREPVFDNRGDVEGYKDIFISPPQPESEIMEHDILVLLTTKDSLKEVENWT